MQDPEFIIEQVTAAVTPLPPIAGPLSVPVLNGMATGWNVQKVASLVRDIAMELYDEPTILAKHGVPQADYEKLKQNQFFKAALEQELIAWHSPQSATRRLALEAAMAVEDALPTVAARLHNKNEPLSDVTSLLKVLSELAGAIGSKAQGPQGAGGQFKITINLGADTVARDAHPIIMVNADPAAEETLAIRALAEGHPPQATLPFKPEGRGNP